MIVSTIYMRQRRLQNFSIKTFQIETIIPMILKNFLVLQHNPNYFIGTKYNPNNSLDLLIFSKNCKLEKKVEVGGWDIQLIECQKGKMVIVFDGKLARFVDLKKYAIVHEIEFHAEYWDVVGWGCLFNNNIIILHDFETIKLVDEYTLEVIKEIKYDDENSFGNPSGLLDCSDCDVFYTENNCMFGIMDITFKEYLIQEEE